MKDGATARSAGGRPQSDESLGRAAKLPAALADHLERFLAGVMDLASFRLELANSLYDKLDLAADMPMLLAQLRDTGYLPEHIYDILLRDVESIASEEVPTETMAAETAKTPELPTRELVPPAPEPQLSDREEAAPAESAETDSQAQSDTDMPIRVEHVEMGEGDRRYRNESTQASAVSEPTAEIPDRAEPALRRLRRKELRDGALINNRFLLEEKLPGGSLGEIYRATDREGSDEGQPGPTVAIKFVNQRVCDEAGAILALHQQYARLRGLSHPNIVSVFDFDEFDGRAYLTMEWLEGESLAARLDRSRPRPLSLSLSHDIVRQIGDALQYAHEHNQVHGDIKPGNIFLSKDGLAKLMDFGLVRASGSRALADSLAVTRAYASPQVLEGQPPDETDDIFAFACIIYRMLAGRRPYGGMNALEAAMGRVRPRKVPGLSKQAWRALARGLALEPRKRPESVAELIDPIFPPGSKGSGGLRIAGIGLAGLALGMGWWLGWAGPTAVLSALADVLLWIQAAAQQVTDLIRQQLI